MTLKNRSEVEAALGAIWMDVLGVAEVRPDDDFFDLGGHSLIAIAMIEQIREQTGVALTMAHLHRASTVAALTDEIVRALEQPNGR